MANAKHHPDYGVEVRHLELTLEQIDRQVEGFRLGRVLLAYENADAKAQWQQERHFERKQLLSLRSEPYFARIDFRRSEQTEARQIYIGKGTIRGAQERGFLAFDWRAPIAQLFYQGGIGEAQYESPRGSIRGQVLLRRRFQIRDSILEEIVDDGVITPTAPVDASTEPVTAGIGQNHHLGDEFLIRLLESRQGGALRDIVESIQSEQDRIIRMTPDQSLIVQGVAGSGKTSVALHRLAYLLYSYQDRITPDRTLVLGPNRLFLQSVADVLPALGVQQVRQTTFEDWALGWLNRSVRPSQDTKRASNELRCDQTSELLEVFLDPQGDRAARVQIFQRSRLLGSQRMIKLLDAYVASLRKAVATRLRQYAVIYELPSDTRDGPTLEYTHVGQKVHLDLDERSLQRILSDTARGPTLAPQPLNSHRSAFVSRLIEELWRQFAQTPEYPRLDTTKAMHRRVERSRRAAFNNAIESVVVEQVAAWWPVRDPVMCFNDVFASSETPKVGDPVSTLTSSGIFTSQEALLLAQPARKRDDIWPIETLPILLYLDMALNGAMTPTYSHILVDEVQDMSPLQIATLLKAVPGGALTLLGDVAQGVYSYRGIASWSELEAVFGARRFARVTMVNSYRSTYEITTLANAALKAPVLVQRGVELAVPVARHGLPPQLQQWSTWEELARAVHETVTTLKARNAQSIAVICKTAKHCERLRELLASHAAEDALPVVTSTENSSRPMVATMPAYMAKGLEFDSVIVVGADAQTFSASEYDTKLLYLSLTRALNKLYVYWIGDIAEVLRTGLAAPVAAQVTVTSRSHPPDSGPAGKPSNR